jgi:hypothetical protein
MKQQDYHCSITANVTAKEAFESISHVSAWWAKHFEGSAQQLDDVFTVRFGETYVTFKIVKWVPNKTIVWEVTDCYLHWLKDKTEWKGTKTAWDIAEMNHTTQINFTHQGLVPQVECYGNCVKGWDQYIKGSLLTLLTQKEGIPG